MNSLQDRKKLASDTLFYIDKIADKLTFKLRGITDTNPSVKVLIHDAKHAYNNDAIKLMAKTFERKQLKIFMSKYRKTTTGHYAYIFTVSKMN